MARLKRKEDDGRLQVEDKVEWSEESDDEPETISLDTSKSVILAKLKGEREIRRIDKEKRRMRDAILKEQKKKQHKIVFENSEDETGRNEGDTKDKIGELKPLPDQVLDQAFNQSKSLKFEFGDEDELNGCNFEKEKMYGLDGGLKELVEQLPYQIVEIGRKGVARISREETKARKRISSSRFVSAGSQARRIGSSLDRSRKIQSATHKQRVHKQRTHKQRK